MGTNEEMNRDVAWLETWVSMHPTARAASRIEKVLELVKALSTEETPVETGVPLRTTAEKYKNLADLVDSWIPTGSAWEHLEGEELVNNYIWHLYHSHTLGCVECFGGSHRV